MKTSLPSTSRAFAHGQCSGCIEKHLFAERLTTLRLEVEERAHRIEILEIEGLTIEFDQDTEEVATIEGTGTLASVHANALHLHQALACGEIRHWIEITDAAQNRLQLLHYDWPDES